MQLVWIDEREPDQDAGVDPITFGMALVVATQISHFLTIDQVDRDVLTGEEDGDGEPSHASRFQDDLYGRIGVACRARASKCSKVGGRGLHRQDWGEHGALRIRNHRFVAAVNAKSIPMVRILPLLAWASFPRSACGGPSLARRPGRRGAAAHLPSLRLIRGVSVRHPQRS